MKIIKEGSLKRPITFECSVCKCQFIAEDDEYITHGALYPNKYAVVSCPCCGYTIVEDLK